MNGKLSRRGFIIGAGAVGAGLSGFPGGNPAAAAGSRSSASPLDAGNLWYYRPKTPRGTPRAVETDICVYGGSSAGVIAAVQAARLGKSVVLAVFGRHIGGPTSSGLGATDVGNSDAIGGLSREFYERVGARYGKPIAFTFEPHVAEEVFEDWLAEYGVRVYREQHLWYVRMRNGALSEIVMEDRQAFHAGVFVDATYEGDLMARAGVSYTVGRESDDVYGETWNGYHISTHHQFNVPIDPYLTPGDPGSGLLPLISTAPPGTAGQGDRRVQAYCFRLCLTQADDRLPFPRPRGYDPDRYELLLRYLRAGVWDVFGNNQAMPNGKTDLNNNGAVATDNIGAGEGWPDGDYHRREHIFQDHVRYQQGLLYFLAHDSRVPQHVHDDVNRWGLPRDEFQDTGGWSHELYVREGRRMISDYVMTEHDCIGRVTAEDPIGLASYTMDSHNCERIVIDGHPRNEGNVETRIPGPYPISYRSIVPAEGECANLVVPAALSSSHIGYGSIRMEPVFMILGHAAATAASLALDAAVPVQAVDYAKLRGHLLADGTLLEWPPRGPFVVETDPHSLRAGEATEVTATLRDDEGAPITGVLLDLTSPPGWSVRATSRTKFDEVAPGGSVAATWMATVPAPDEPVSIEELLGTARYSGPAGPTTREATAPVYLVEPIGDPYRTFRSAEAYFGQRGQRLAIAAGGADLWTDKDQYGAIYLSQAAGQKAVVTVKLVSQDPTSPNARAGLMLRDDVTGAGRSLGYVVLAAKPVHGFLLMWDADGDGFVESVGRADTGTTPYPAWLRLERDATSAVGSYSTDGTNWHVIGRANLPSAAERQDAAVFTTSHDPSIGRSVFEAFTVENTPA